MHGLLVELLKHELSIAIASPMTKAQLILANDQIPMGKEEFKKFFMILTDNRAATQQQRVIIGCHMLSECTIQEIKYNGKTPQFMDWLNKTKTFVESDTLGITKMMTIGYLMRLHPQYTNHNNLKTLLLTVLEDITLDPTLAIKLDPTLKDDQNEAMTNGDMFIPTLLSFEVYKT